MSLIFRAVVVGRGVQRFLSSASSFKFNLDLPVPNKISCTCKFLQTTGTSFRRDYSTKSSATEAAGKEKVGDTEVVYKGILAQKIRILKIFSLSTSFIGLALQPVLYQKVVLAGQVTAATIPVLGMIAVMALSTPPLLHYIAKRYIISVEYDSKNDKYISTTYSLFALKQKTEFTPDDVSMPTVQGMFSNCLIKGKPSFLDSVDFTDQDHYIRIMGYDKPLDFQVDDNEIDSDDEDWSKNNKKAK